MGGIFIITETHPGLGLDERLVGTRSTTVHVLGITMAAFVIVSRF